MKKIAISLLLVSVILLNTFSVLAITSGEAKLDWEEARQITAEKREAYRESKIEFATNQDYENRVEVVRTGKEFLHATLNEAEAWLIWKDAEVDESILVSEVLKNDIKNDIEKNLAKIDDLREDVDKVTNQLELGVTFLKMIDGYFGLITDVARNSGKMWVNIGNELIETAEEYESKMRTAAETMQDNEEVIEVLDLAKDDLDEAQENVNKAKRSYEKVVYPGTPLANFAEGNDYLKIGRSNLLSAHSNLERAYAMMLGGE